MKKEILKERIAITVFVVLFLFLADLISRDYSTLLRVACFVLALIFGLGFYLILVVVESAIEIKKEEKEKRRQITMNEKSGAIMKKIYLDEKGGKNGNN